MGDVIKKKILRYELASILLAVLLFIYIFIVIMWNISYQGNDRHIRISLNLLRSYLQENSKSFNPEKLPKVEYPYCVFDAEGKVLASTMSIYTPGKKSDLTTLGSISYYCVPILSNQEVVGLLLADTAFYRQNTLKKYIIAEVLIGFLFILILTVLQYLIYRILSQDVWKPIEEIHDSTKSILQGNMNQEVKYDYSGEVGTLCHDFEQMRDEIQNGYLREKQSREKERILYASISHDLKTPLSIIAGYLEKIRYGVAHSPAQIQESATHALAKTQVLNKLIDDILEHSKAQLNQLSIQYQEIYANVFFEELLKQYETEAVNQQYQLQYTTPPAVLLSIDPDRIEQVVQNIIGNAVKYSETDLEILISFEIVAQQQRILIVNMKDNGPGINATDLPFVFELFYRGNKARTQNIPGSGMGLNISKYIIEQHGGHIECDSIMGLGTTISFSLPIL